MPFITNARKRPNCFAREIKWGTTGFRAAVFGKSLKEKYTGWFVNDKKHGKGLQTYEDGTFYEGDWENDKRNGYGYLSYVCPATQKTLRIYTGLWKDGFPTGSGMKSFPKGGMYRGEFRYGLRHGIGVFIYTNGDIYTGQWYKDQRHGVGRLIQKETGNYYEGQFRNDKKCGLGRYYHLTKGQVQEGVWLDNQPEVTFVVDDPEVRKDAPDATEFEIPPLTVLKAPNDIYLARAHEVLESIGKMKDDIIEDNPCDRNFR